MSSATVTTHATDTSAERSEIIHDKQALQIKHQVMDKMRKYSMLTSISDSCKFVAGPLFGIGTTLMISALTLAASAALMPIAIGMLVGAAAMLAGGVTTGYFASRMWQSGQFDNLEINAESTARHLVQELKTSRSTTVEEHTQNVRADGKKWAQVVSKDPNAIAQPST